MTGRDAIASGIDVDPVHGQRFMRLPFELHRAAAERAVALLRPRLASRKPF